MLDIVFAVATITILVIDLFLHLKYYLLVKYLKLRLNNVAKGVKRPELNDLTQRIEMAAIKDHNGIVYVLPRPARHPDIIALMATGGVPTPINGEQGFVDNFGFFRDRIEAKAIAKKAGQILPGRGKSIYLFSEDLW